MAVFLGRTSLSPLLLLVSAILAKTEVLVTVQQGVLRGKTATSVYNTSYSAFLGIPYAEAPLGDLRFKAPAPARSWEGIRNATEYGNDCLQKGGTGSEDCLYLNVFVPGVPQEGAQLPVIFWVHGGGFVDGSGSDKYFGPDFLVSYGVIFVTINYRLGALGFLSTGDKVVPGNAGMKDQQLALSWVHRNIASFGGDPNLVALQGASAGGDCVSLHLLSPRSAGLFSRLIDQSGNFIGSWAITPNPRHHAFRLGAVLGYEAEDSQQLVEFLRSVNGTDLLVNNSLLMTDEEKVYFVYSVWAPNIEPDLEGAFITESPIRIFKEGRYHKVPVLTGVTSAETGTITLGDAAAVRNLNEHFNAAVGPCLHLPTAEQQQEVAPKLRSFYFGNGTISADNPEPIVLFSKDIVFMEPHDTFVRKVAETTDIPVFFYEFDYHLDSEPQSKWGLFHGREQPFMFFEKNTKYNLDLNSNEDRVRRNVLRLWTNFTKYGNPTPEADPVVWESYNLTSRSYLLIQANITLAHNKDGERMDFWNQNVPLFPFHGT